MLLQSHGKPKGASLPKLTLDADLSPHQFDYIPRDGEPESGPSVLAGGETVGLGERLEHALHHLGRNADTGVGDFESNHHRVVCLIGELGAQDNFSLFCKLDRIA